MFAEMVAAHETLVADGAGEALLSGVGAEVPLELIGAGEPLTAEEPIANEGSLPRVPAQVSLQMRRLAVYFAAAGDMAAVQTFPSKARPRGT